MSLLFLKRGNAYKRNLSKRLLAVIVLLGLSTQVCSEVRVEGAWVRLLPSVVKTTAAYLSITSTENDRILAIESDAASRAEMHDSKMEDGMMSMMPQEHIDLPAGETLQFKPHGLHIMLIGLKEPLSEGASVTLELLLEKAGRVSVSAQVRKGAEKGAE